MSILKLAKNTRSKVSNVVLTGLDQKLQATEKIARLQDLLKIGEISSCNSDGRSYFVFRDLTSDPLLSILYEVLVLNSVSVFEAEMEAEKIAKSEAEENLLVDPPNTDEANLGDDSEGSTPLNAGEKEILDTLSVEDGMEGVGEDYSDENDDIDMSSLSQFAGLPESFVADQANQLMPWNEQALGGNDVNGIQPFTEEEIAFLVTVSFRFTYAYN